MRATELGRRFLEAREYERAIRYLRKAFTLCSPPLPLTGELLRRAETEVRASPLYCSTCLHFNTNCACDGGPSHHHQSHPAAAAPAGAATPFSTADSSSSSSSSYNHHHAHAPAMASSISINSISQFITTSITSLAVFIDAVWKKYIAFVTPFFIQVIRVSPLKAPAFATGLAMLLFLAFLRLITQAPLVNTLLYSPIYASPGSSSSSSSFGVGGYRNLAAHHHHHHHQNSNSYGLGGTSGTNFVISWSPLSLILGFLFTRMMRGGGWRGVWG